jgi:hypothetical protein
MIDYRFQEDLASAYGLPAGWKSWMKARTGILMVEIVRDGSAFESERKGED